MTPTKGKGSGSAVASAASSRFDAARKQRKKARRRAKRREERRQALQFLDWNPAGAKLVRRFRKAESGERTDFAAAASHYARRVEPTFRVGESRRRREQVAA
jgi:hypothetical protein